MDAHIASGKISLHTNTKLQAVSWDMSSQTWNCTVSSPDITLPAIDHIVFATGIQSDIRTIPYLQKIQHHHPIECVGGLPCLTDDLMWHDDIPLFITGRFAGLKLGPGAPNLVGARIGAERIAWNVDDVLKRLGKSGAGVIGSSSDREIADQKMAAYAAARNNRFDSLVDRDNHSEADS